jgi:glycerol 3-phosphatase-2
MAVCPLGEGADNLAQGLTPSTTPADLANLAGVIDTCGSWYVTNADRMVIRDSGPLSGNGTVLRSLRKLTPRSPVLAGKPTPHLLHTAAARIRANRPLVIGDQLDTDIAAAHSAGMASLLVMTGLCDQASLDRAPAQVRPTHRADDLSVLNL